MTYTWHANLSTNFLNKFLTKNKWKEICLRKCLRRYTTVTNKLHVQHSNLCLIKLLNDATSYNTISIKDIPFQLWYHWDDVTVQLSLLLCSHQTLSAEYQALHFPYLSIPIFQGIAYLNFPFFKARIPPFKDYIMTEYKTLTFGIGGSCNSVPVLFYYDCTAEKN